jgi:hypothetical protein
MKKHNTVVSLLAFIPFYPMNVLVRPMQSAALAEWAAVAAWG